LIDEKSLELLEGQKQVDHFVPFSLKLERLQVYVPMECLALSDVSHCHQVVFFTLNADRLATSINFFFIEIFALKLGG